MTIPSNLNMIAALPEIYLLCLLGFVLVFDLFIGDAKRHLTYGMTLVGLVVAIFVQIGVGVPADPEAQKAFSGMFVNDKVAQISKIVMYISTFFALAYSRRYALNRQIWKGEYYTLTLFSLLGMNIMVSATNFVTLFLGLELLSLALYALIALRRDDVRASEAAAKYFILGSMSSGILLYGFSLIYGATGSLQISGVFDALSSPDTNEILMVLGLVFVVVGLAFKFGAAPFHMWVPDVYEGASTTVAAFVSSVPKVAAMVFSFRILMEGMQHNLQDWQGMMAVIAVVSLLIGNLAAIAQTNFKRMLGYSTVSHMGFVLLGFVGNGAAQSGFSTYGLSAALYYVITYSFMSLVAFGVITALSNKGKECSDIKDLAGLNQKHPWYALLMLLAMFSMAGIPPLMGFYAKMYVILGLVEQQMAGLAVFSVIMALIGAFYYLRVVKVMYMDKPEDDIVVEPDFSAGAKLLLTINAFILLVFGIAPKLIMDLCAQAFSL